MTECLPGFREGTQVDAVGGSAGGGAETLSAVPAEAGEGKEEVGQARSREEART